MTAPTARIVDGVSQSGRYVTSEDGAIADIINYLDDEGEETDDQEFARVAIVKWRDGELWSAVDLTQFTTVRGH